MHLPLRKADYLLLILFLALAAIIAFAPLLSPASGGEEKVRILCRGKEFGIYPLEEDREIEINQSGHKNLVQIKENSVYMEYSDCKNQVCVHTGRISRAGETIVCLPNWVVVEIFRSAEGGESDDAIDAIVK